MTNEVDYKRLLTDYLNHVGEQEGTCFLGRSLDNNIDFSDKDREILRKLEIEAAEKE
jgi:hypothetical protein